MAINRDVTEKGEISYTFTFDDFGFIPDVVFEWDASVTYGGEAHRNVDYTVSTNESITSVEVTFSATDDGIIENVEDAVLTLNGYIDWIAPDKGAGAFYQNILGELVFGELERVPISETLTVSINSLPNPVDQQIFAITGSDEPLLNLLEQPVDGDQESVSAKAENFSDSGFSISILENGDVVVTDAPDEVASTTVSYTVMDEFGAEAQAELTVSTATLLLRNPSTQLILTEGVAAPTFDFQLSNPIDQDIVIKASLSQSGFEKDVELLTATIPAGGQSVDAELIRVLTNAEELEKVQTDTLTVTATVGGKSIPIFLGNLGGQASTEHSFDIELTDRVTAGLEQSQLAESFAQIKLATKATKDLFNVLTTADIATDRSLARKVASDFAKKIGLVLDASKAIANLSANLDNASQLQGDERYVAEHLAVETFAVDLVDAAAKEVATKFGAAGLAAVATWGLGFAGVASVPVALPVLATVGIGWGLSVAYDSFAKEHVRDLTRSIFRDAVDKDKYKDLRKDIDEAKEDLDETLNNILGSNDTDDTLVGTAGSDFAFLGAGDDSYNTMGGNDFITSGLGNDLIVLGYGSHSLIGKLEEHFGDRVEGFFSDDQIILKDIALTEDDVRVTFGSAILGFDADGDGSVDGSLILEGDFSNGEFVVTVEGDNTVVTFVPAPLVGTPGPDVINGTQLDDTIDALGSDDRIHASAGTDNIDGGTGTDTVVYALNRDQVSHDLMQNQEITIEKPDGDFDSLKNVERIDFDDGSLLYDVDTPNLDFGYRIYQASFDRTPDEGGVLFWIGVLDQLDLSNWSDYDKEQFLASQFIESDEFQDLFGADPTNEQYIDAMYLNVLDRLPDQGGYDFWVGGMEQGLTREDILIAFTKSDENVARTAPDLDDGVWVV